MCPRGKCNLGAYSHQSYVDQQAGSCTCEYTFNVYTFAYMLHAGVGECSSLSSGLVFCSFDPESQIGGAHRKCAEESHNSGLLAQACSRPQLVGTSK